MSSEKYSIRARELADETEQKFDYFVTGLSAALVSYLVPKVEATALGFNPATLELFAILLFVASTLAGLKRIEASVRLRSVIAFKHRSTEAAADLQDAAREGRSLVSVKTDKVRSPEQMRRLQAFAAEQAEKTIEESKAIEKTKRRWYSARTLALSAGFLSLLAASVWRGYCQ